MSAKITKKQKNVGLDLILSMGCWLDFEMWALDLKMLKIGFWRTKSSLTFIMYKKNIEKWPEYSSKFLFCVSWQKKESHTGLEWHEGE